MPRLRIEGAASAIPTIKNLQPRIEVPLLPPAPTQQPKEVPDIPWTDMRAQRTARQSAAQ